MNIGDTVMIKHEAQSGVITDTWWNDDSDEVMIIVKRDDKSTAICSYEDLEVMR